RGMRRSHFRNSRQYLTQCFGGADEFLEHGRVYSVFSQRNVFVSHPVFCPLAIIDVRTRRIPAHDMPLIISQRVVPDQEPTKLSVLSSGSLFDLEREACDQESFALLLYIPEVIRMENSGTEVLCLHVFRAQARVLQQSLVRVQDFPFRVHNVDCLRYGIRYLPKLYLVLPELLFRPLSVLDVGVAAKPLDDIPLLIE